MSRFQSPTFSEPEWVERESLLDVWKWIPTFLHFICTYFGINGFDPFEWVRKLIACDRDLGPICIEGRKTCLFLFDSLCREWSERHIHLEGPFTLTMQLLSAVQPTMSIQAQFAFITHLMDLLGLSSFIVEKNTLSPLESYNTHLQSFQIVSCRRL